MVELTFADGHTEPYEVGINLDRFIICALKHCGAVSFRIIY